MNKGIYLKTADIYLRFPEIMEEECNDLAEFLEDEHIVYEGATDIVYNLQKENQELKKQLEENQNPLKGIFAQVNDDTLLRDCGNMNAEIKELKNQQKEFIKYMNDISEDLETEDVDDEEIDVVEYKEYQKLEKETENLQKQLDYLRSGEYYNQLRFERDMLQDLVDKKEILSKYKEITGGKDVKNRFK